LTKPPADSAPPAASPPIRTLAEVVENRAEGGADHRPVLAVAGWPGAGPGQFAMLSAGARTAVERSDPLLPRPMAIYRGHAPGGRAPAAVDILYKVTGRGTALLAEALPGQRVGLVGPLGRGFAPLPETGRAVLVGGGTGIASLFELAARHATDREVVVVLGARTASDLMGVADFEKLPVTLRVATEDGSAGTPGRVTDVLGPLLEDGGASAVYACGPTPMMRACADLAAGAGARCTVSLENNMACGYGVCLGCAVPLAAGGYSLVCRAGPVYDADDVAWAGLP